MYLIDTMLDRPWLHNSDWDRQDSKLRQLSESPIQLPHLDKLLSQVPIKEGIFSLLGPRQVGKSTFLRLLILKCLKKTNPEKIVLLEGDEFDSWRDLRATIMGFLEDIPHSKKLICICIDEITVIPEWFRCIKTLADQGRLQNIFLFYTGSSAVSLREGGELFPGRRGKNNKVDFELFPVAYKDVAKHLSLEEYFVVGGFPWAVNEYIRLKTIPDHVGEIYYSWLKGEFIKRGKSDVLLRHLLQSLTSKISSGFSNVNMAQDMGISSHDTAREYLQLLKDCYATFEVMWVDIHQNRIGPRKNRKHYPLDPLLFHLFQRGGKFTGFGFGQKIPDQIKGLLAEIVVCTELRRTTDQIFYWNGKKEIDFMPFFIEVKYQNKVLPSDFKWFAKLAPRNKQLLVLTQSDTFKTDNVKAIPLSQWLLKDKKGT